MWVESLQDVWMSINKSLNEWNSIRPLRQVRGYLKPLSVNSKYLCYLLCKITSSKSYMGYLLETIYLLSTDITFVLSLPVYFLHMCRAHIQQLMYLCCRFYFFLFFILAVGFRLDIYHRQVSLYCLSVQEFVNIHRDRVSSCSLEGLAILENFINHYFHTIVSIGQYFIGLYRVYKKGFPAFQEITFQSEKTCENCNHLKLLYPSSNQDIIRWLIYQKIMLKNFFHV